MLSRIQDDLKSALKSGDKKRVGTLRLLLAALKNDRIQAQRDLTQEEVEAATRRAVKQRRESIEQYRRGNRDDLAASEEEELRILETYLPRGLTEEELEAAIRGIVAEKGFTSQKDVGLLMKELMGRHRGRVDGKRAQEIARRLLAS